MSDRELTDLVSHIPGILYKCRNDKDWTMKFISKGCFRLTGYREEELIDNSLLSYNDLILEEFQDEISQKVVSAVKQKKAFKLEYKIRTKDGRIKWVWEQGLGIFDGDKFLALEGFITDITSHKLEELKLKEEIEEKSEEVLVNVSLLNEYKKAVDMSAIVSKTDTNGKITYVNNEFCKVSGYQREELIGKTHRVVQHKDTPKSLYKALWKSILSKKTWKGVIKNRTKDNKAYYVKASIIPILDKNGDIAEFISIRNDVTELIKKEQKIKEQTTDSLTHLPNRQKLIEDIENSQKCQLAIINIDRFKEINEYYGYKLGDKVLIEVAHILKEFADSAKLKSYRISGDEFAILDLECLNLEHFLKKINKIIDIFERENINIESNEFNISIRVGVATNKNLYINAEIALENAKETNKTLICYENSIDIKERHKNNITWTKKLKKALSSDDIVVFAQPIFDNKSETISKYECLVRLKEDDKIVSPFYFLEVAKKARLYPEITKTIIKKSLSYFSDKECEFSINFTIEDVLSKEIKEYLLENIEKYGVANRLVVEIVESEGIENFDEVSSFIENIKSLGVKIAIDDFGTGYSNFEYLMKLNVDFIKIDGSIIKNLDRDRNSQIVTKVIVDFAKSLNIKTIGEYVHNEEVLQKVKEMGITYSQGFHLGEPTDLTDI